MAVDDRDLIEQRTHSPRFAGGDNWGNQICIALLIDWLDSRPEHADADRAALRRRADRDPIVLAAAALTGRLGRPPHAGELAIDGHSDHATGYAPSYHANVVGHLAEDELEPGCAVYRRLYEVAPDCLSALANLAESERRSGHVAAARALLDDAIERASSSTNQRHLLADRLWLSPLRCARARLDDDAGDGAALLALAAPETVPALVARLRAYGSWDTAGLLIHQAFAVASATQRIVLHTAMRLAPIIPRPPPAAHESFDALVEVEALVQLYGSAA